MSSLDMGIDSQGAVSKSHDKYGKRMYVCTPKQDMSKKDQSYSARSGIPAFPKNSEQDRSLSDVGIK